MLNNIFQKYSKNNESNLKKEKEAKVDDFLNEEENLSLKKKSEEALKKYCHLYDELEDSSNKYSIKPLNHQFVEKKNRKVEHQKSTGEGWFNMKAPELTPEIKEDLKAIQLRHIIDPGRFYKKLDQETIPKFFQIGTIMDNILDGKKNRLKKNEIKQSIAEEFLESDMVKKYSLRKFEELQEQRRKLGLRKNKLNKYKMQNRKKSRKAEYIPK